ncbi:MAG: DNA-directed RNA polymerase subunit omega [Fidelibacterota bacterium]|nr:MAG: DNA-directed RNA polymerase subunit omega [Candidatus Neomarinimicrobiota bacterium]
MKLETLSFQEILGHTPDVFEAVVVAGQRARQINARRAAERVDFTEEYPEEDYLPVEPIDEDDYIEEDKSTVLAMEDFLGERLEWRFVEDEGEDATEASQG